MLGSDGNTLLPMPVGTVITAVPVADGCSVGDIGGSPVVNVIPAPGSPNQDLKTKVSIGLKGCASGQKVIVKIAAPSGLVASQTVILN